MVAISALPCSYAKAWSPSDMQAPLTVWYKADSISGSDGSSVASWEDSSGNTNTVVQFTTARRPKLQTNELNGYSVLRFDGSNDILSDGDIAALDVGSGDIWMAVVFKSTDDSGSQFFFEKEPTSFALMTTAAGELQARLGSTTNIPKQNSGNWSRTGFVIATAFRSSSTCSGFVNGSAMDTTGTTNTAKINNTSVLDIGATAVGGNPMTGDIAEILIGGGTITEKELKAVEGYLADKYGLRINLLSTHKFKKGKPWGLGKK